MIDTYARVLMSQLIEALIVGLMILAVSVLLMVLLQLIVQKTKMGKAMRAVSVDSDAAQLMGINVNRTISCTSKG